MEKWNYLMPIGSNEELQIHWNQTLNTMLNVVSKDKEIPVLIKVPNKLKPIVESLMFYKNNKIGDRYTVEFIDIDSNIIDISDSKLEVENF